jgi:cellulose synthase/poly-beta-1,6-N-acetylglucosamine synthase-like glycosyltransferase
LGGKVGDVMIQGDDYEPLMHLHRAGWEIWYAPSLQAEHQIPAWRLEPEYFKRLIHGSCLCICQLRLIITPRWRQPWVMLKMAAGSLRRAGRHWLRHRGQFQTNWIAMWELEWHLSTFWSPFFYLSTRLRSGQKSQRRIDP